MQISARVIAFILFLLALALNEWAFELVLPNEREVDYFVRFLVLVADIFFADVIAVLLFFGKDLSLSQTQKKISELFPKLTAFYFGLFVSFVIFCCAEFGTRYYFKHFYKPPFKDVTEWNPQPTIKDSLFAYRLPEKKIIQHRYLVNDSLIYEQHYKIDSFSRRETPVDTISKALPAGRQDKFIAVAGCSFAFGYGVNDNETLTYFLQQQMPGYEGYNYGVSGYGTQHLLLQTREKIIPKEIKEKEGILIYFFIDNHLNRLVGSRRIIKLWGENFPYFFLDDDGKLETKRLPAGRQGTFKTGRKWKTLFYKTITNSAIVDILDLEIPFSIGKNDFKLAVAVIAESKKEFEKNFPGSKFVVLFCPGSKCSGELAALLAKKNIDFVDYSLLFDINSKEYRSHYSDPHPNGKAYEEIAKKFKSYINIE